MRIIRVGDRYNIANEEVKTFDLLPVQTYLVTFSNLEGFSLKPHPNMEVKEKIYGIHEQKVKKMIRSFQAFERNLGIILSGEKGIGKTVFSRMMCKEAIKQGYPVLIVDEAYPGIGRFIESIDQECVVLFDEFDKTFSKQNMGGAQAKLLSLFDGTAGGKKMFLITCNDIGGLNHYLINRPGRCHYHLRFEYPKSNEIREYLKDKLKEEYYDQIDSVVAFASRVNVNFDCLRAIAFELNQGISFKEAIKDLNILHMSSEHYDVYLYLEDGTILKNKSWYGDLFGMEGKIQRIYFDMDNQGNIWVEFDIDDLYFDVEKQLTVVAGEKLKIVDNNFGGNIGFGGYSGMDCITSLADIDENSNDDYEEDDYDDDYDDDDEYYDYDCDYEDDGDEVDYCEEETGFCGLVEIGGCEIIGASGVNPESKTTEIKPLYLAFVKSTGRKMHYEW